MKRKLFTLLVAFLALASFQVNADETRYLIHAADTSRNVNTGTKWGIPTYSATPAWGATSTYNYAYVGQLAWPARLVADKDKGWTWAVGEPTNTDKKIYLKQGPEIGANFTKFVEATDETNVFSLTYKGITYDKFIIFRGKGAFEFDRPVAASQWAVAKDVAHAGYLAVNTAASTRDPNLVIVLVKTVGEDAGKLILEDLKFLMNNLSDYAPFAFYAELPVGHWATTADFAGAKYWDFSFSVATDSVVHNGKNANAVNTFTVTQVDYVNKKPTAQSGQNIFGNTDEKESVSGAVYYNTKFDSLPGGLAGRGLQTNAHRETVGGDKDSVIPLFILSSPKYGCKVVSVSRENDLDIQTHVDGGYGNRLELREFGKYWDYFGATGRWEPHQADITFGSSLLWDAHRADPEKAGTPALNESRVATSLQKFAIWIDEEGNKTIYPAATYSWLYGDDHKKQVSKVVPNSVLIYNNPGITAANGIGDQAWGIQIDNWKPVNNLDKGNTKVGDPVTGPNALQANTDYSYHDLEPKKHSVDNANLKDKFFFLEVSEDLKRGTTWNDAGLSGRYQEDGKTKYVLSTEVQADGTKKLIALPKERVRSYTSGENYWYEQLKAFKPIENSNGLLKDYWADNPYDSVNMAAHWAFYWPDKTGKPDSVMIINMLGDTLQYNFGTSPDVDNIVGGYLAVSNQMAYNGTKEGPFSLEGNSSAPWFATNTKLSGVDTKKIWGITAVPGKESQGFVLNLNGYDLTLNAGWQEGPTHAKKPNSIDSLYYQKFVSLQKSSSATDTVVVKYPNAFNCAGGTILTQTPIYYVPNFSGSYATEDKTINLSDPWQTINTNDGKFNDPNAKVFKDSLTAYLLLDGTYGILEAAEIRNNLLLGVELTETNHSAAALKAGGTTDIEFIPLVTVAKERNKQIREAIGTRTDLYPAATDTLYNETYKWFIVKTGGKYLSFDTISPNSLNNRSKVGFVFEATQLANATPVRLYQPLVGDKLQGNFIFQFQVPANTYDIDKDGKAVPNSIKTFGHTWPDIEAETNLTATVAGGGARVFGILASGQSKHILATIDKSKATRFTYTWKEGPAPTPCNCEDSVQFISPKWMASEKLVGLPIQDQIWLKSGATGYAFTSSAKVAGEAIADQTTSNLTHIYVDSLRRISTPGTRTAYYRNDSAVNVTGFYNDLPVYLYRIKNDAGKYLTVGTSTYQYNSNETVNDVTGVNLIWDDLYPVTKEASKNQAALQLFAITGTERPVGSDGWYSCGTYVYLPLASYKVNYAKGEVIDTLIHYNINLGKRDSTSCSDKASDVTKAYRVSQYSQLGHEHNLIVANASGGNLANVVPVELKWKKQEYDILGCEYQLVYNTATKKYYAGHSTLDNADKNTIIAHWSLKNNINNDPYLHKFAPELTSAYNVATFNDNTGANGNLKSEYYFKKGQNDNVKVFDFTKYTAADTFKIGISEFVITCIDHALPFYKLEEVYDLPARMAILEAPYVDRNLSDVTPPGFPANELIRNEDFRVYMNKILPNFEDATYLNAYKTYERKLADGLNEDKTGHDIWYYSFSLTKPEGEYFLNVRRINDKDSVFWTKLSENEIIDLTTLLSDAKANEHLSAASNTNWKTYKFCLPYQWDLKGRQQLQDSVQYGDGKYPPVYLQTLDVASTDYPYLVVAGSSSALVTAKKLTNVMVTTGSALQNVTTYNIYGVDYSKIDKEQVTAWIFGGEQSGDHEWVPLYDPATQTHGEKSVDGLLANYKAKQAGYGFVAESQKDPVNYGVLLEKTLLHFEWRGKEKIGTYAKRPIYYYGIQIKDAAEKWLTDSYGKGSDYVYSWGNAGFEQPYNLAFFGAELSQDYVDKAGSATNYDKSFVQTFGLRYTDVVNGENKVGDDKLADQTFTVVSNTKYEDTKPGEYRYLAEVNGHLVFVTDIKNALLFQFGRDKDGDYTGIDVIGNGGVLGVSGGVRLLDHSGDKVDLYTVDGSLIKSVVVTGADQTIVAPRGVVIVKAAGKATKVVVK